MGDPLSAISLAGNICQFVQFTSALFSEAREFYDSNDGLSKATGDTRLMSESMKGCAERIKKLPSSKGQEVLAKLCATCRDVADDLLKALEKLEEKGTQQGKRASLRQSLYLIWKKDDIEKLHTRMRDLRSQLTAAVILSMRSVRNYLDPFSN
jgi:hypothetical protein